MLENNSELTQPQYLEQLNTNILVANAISYSLLFSLRRQYLSIPLEEAKYIQPVPPKGVNIGKPYLLQVEQVGNSMAGSLNQPFTTLQTALSTCHNPGRYALVSIISSDGRQNRIYLGLRSPHTMDSDVVQNLGQFLQGNWQGTKCNVVNPKHFQNYIQEPLNKKFQYAYALTGIPSLNSGDSNGYPQTLDCLLRGMRGIPFMYMVIAEPMPETEVNEIIYRLRELMGCVQSLGKITFNETSTVGQSQTKGKTVSLEKSQATAKSLSKAYQVTDTSNTSIAMTIADGLSALADRGKFIGQLIPSVAFLANVANAVRNLAPELTRTWQASEGTTQTSTEAEGHSVSETTGWSQSTAQTFGQEYINAHAQAAEAQIKKYIERFEQARALGCWNVGVYLLAENPYILQNISAQLRSLLSGNNSVFEPIRTHDLQRVWLNSDSDIAGAGEFLRNFDQPSLGLVNLQSQDEQQQIDHHLGKVFNGLTTPLNNQELALLINLPRHELPGVSVMPTATFSLNPPVVKDKAITLGCLLEGGEPTNLTYDISCKNLAKHCLVTGLTESGKSTTCKKILNELNQQQIPFLVIEPAHEEYVEWAIKRNQSLSSDSPEQIAIYIPGIQTWRGYNLENQLNLNPFDIVWLAEETTPHILSHIDRLKFILSAAFPIHETLPLLLEEALFNVYSHSHNWLADQLPPFTTSYPTLTEFINQIQAIAREKGYEQQIIAALTTRIQSLRRGWKKQLFDQPQSTAFAEIFDRPTVINLSYLSDDTEKAFAMALLLQFLYEYRQAQYELMGEEERQNHHLRHLTVIEEAHRILLRTTPSQLDPANFQGKIADMFANILSQIRTYDQGLLLAEQFPAQLVPNVMKNINLKIVHRLVAADDRDAISACMNLTPDQSVIINQLHLGQAIICGEQDNMAAWVHVAT